MIHRLLSPPVFADDYKTQTARLLNTLLWIFAAATVLYGLSAFPHFAARTFWQSLSGLTTSLSLMYLMRRGRVRLASGLLIVALWLMFTASAVTGGGVHGAAYTANLVIIFMTGLLLGPGPGIVMAGLCVLTGFALAYAESVGALPASASGQSPFSIWTDTAIYFLIVAALQALAGRTVREALAQAQAELTERRHAEETLRAILSAIPDLIFQFDGEGRFVGYQPGRASGAALPPETFLGKTVYEVLPPELAAQTHRATQLALQTGALQQFEYAFPSPAGPRDFEARLVPAAPDRVVSLSRDITESKQAAAALRGAEAKYRTLLEQLPVVAYTSEVGENGVWHFISPQIESLLGFTPAEWMADASLWFRQMHPDDRTRQLALEARALITGESLDSEYRIFTRAGREVWIRDQLRILPPLPGHAPLVQGTLADITERKHAEAEVQRYVARLEVLNEIEQSLRSAQLPQAIAQAATDNLRRLIGCERVSLSLFDFQTEQAFFLAVSSLISTHIPTGAVVPFADFGTDVIAMLRQGQVGRIEDVLTLAEIPATDQQHLADGIRSWLYAPLFYQSELIGSVNLGATRPAVFTPDHADLVRDVANLLAIAIQQSRLFEASQRQVRELTTLHSVAVAITEAENEDELLKRAIRVISDELYSDIIGMLLADPAAGVLRLHPASQGVRPELFNETATIGQGIIGTVARQGRARRLPDVRREPDYVALNPAILSELCVPLKIGERVIGVINLESDRLNGFSEADEQLLMTIAGQLATAIERLRVEAQLRSLNARLEQHVLERTEALRASEETFRALAENNSLSISRYDRQYRYVYANPMTTRRAGFAPTAVIGKTTRQVLGDVPVADFGEKNLQQVFDTGEPHTAIYEYEGHAYEWWLAPEFDLAGQVVSVITTSIDITERRRAEEVLRQRSEELSAANAALAKASRLKDEFLASMSHELRTPLTGILAFSQAMQKQIYGALTEKQLKAVRAIEDSGKHLLELINDILDLSKIEAGKLELEPSLVAVEEICQASLRLVKQMAQTKRHTVTYRLHPPDLRLQADARRLKQMLVNLLSNAVKFTPEGGALGLEVTGDAQLQVARFTVWDTGIGIAAENMPRLFQSFVQLDSRLAREYSGTGLGLALVRRMAEMHGGSVTVESDGVPGKGSRFTLTLPWNVAGGLATAPEAEPQLISKLRQALTVEDSSVVAEQLTRYLGELGIANVVHPRAADVVERAAELQPGVILLDIFLSDYYSGWAVLTQLKADARTRALPVVIISVLDDRPRALALGAADYLIKPVALADLQTTLERVAARATLTPAHPALVIHPARAAQSRPRLLLAEDNEITLSVLSDYLTAEGYAVTIARHGQEAVLRAKEVQPDVILMDVQMPGLDGLEATRLIRRETALATTPIIALTALVMPGDRERCLTAGANEYLAKPVNLEQLARILQAQLSRPV